MTAVAARLSPTERRIVARLALGDTYQQIADRLGIAVDTVSSHRREALLRMRARNTGHLIALAIGTRQIPANIATKGVQDGTPSHP